MLRSNLCIILINDYFIYLCGCKGSAFIEKKYSQKQLKESIIVKNRNEKGKEKKEN
jgi:hypothetical protein